MAEADPLKEARDEAVKTMAATLVESTAMVVDRAIKHSTKIQMALAFSGFQIADGKLTEEGRRALLRPEHPGWRIAAAAAYDPKALRVEITRAARRSGVYEKDAVFDDVVRDMVQALDDTATDSNPLKNAGWMKTLRGIVGMLVS